VIRVVRLLFAAGGIAIVSKLDIFMGRMGGGLPPFVWFAVWTGLGATLLLLSRVHRLRFAREVRRQKLVIVAFGFLSVVSLISGFAAPSTEVAGLRPIFFPLIAGGAYLSGLLIPCIFPSYRGPRAVLTITFTIVVVFVLYEAFFPATFSISQSRSAGLQVNPNGAAILICVLLAALTEFRAAPGTGFWNLLLGVSAAIGVAVTFSRTGFVLIATLAVVWLSYRMASGLRTALRTVIWLAVATVFLVPLALDLLGELSIWQLQEGKTTFVFDEAGNLQDQSVMARLAVAAESIRLWAERPALGWGSGFSLTMPIGPHNMFLARAVENGLVGLLAFSGLLVALFHQARMSARPNMTALIVLVVLVSLVNHNLLEDRSLFVILGALSRVDEQAQGVLGASIS